MKRIIFIAMTFVGFPLSGYGAEYCLSSTTPQKVTRDYAYDYELNTAIDRSGWTWVNREWEGDYYLSSYMQSPDKSSTIKLPELYYKSCSSWKKFWGDCEVAVSSFSEAAKIAFIDGNTLNFLGLQTPKSYAAYGGKITELPSSFYTAVKFRGDVDSIGYAGLRGIEEELLLFNGGDLVTINIPEATKRKDGYPSWALSNDPGTKRSFVHTNALLGNEIFMYEIKEGPKIHKIELDPNIKGWIEPMSEPKTRQMWIIDRDGLYAEISGKFKRVIYLPSNSYIHGPADIGYTDQGNIYFQVVGGNKQKYPFLLISKDENCAVDFSIDNDQLLDVDSLPH
jgi:hypothetical protein